MITLRVMFTKVIFIVIVSSCQPSEDSNFKVKSDFIDLDSLIAQQVEMAKGRKLMKTIEFDGKVENRELQPTHEEWATELNTFKSLNINRAYLVGSYEKYSDPKNMTLEYGLKEGEKGGPLYVKMWTDEHDGLKEIDGALHESNTLYTAEKRYNLRFDPNNGRLLSYEFSGYQKLILRDTVQFKIMGRIK